MNQEYRRCPFCDEEIRFNAKICRFCNRAVGLDSPPAPHYDSGQMVASQLSGRYEILDSLGKGGMATVYKARQISLDRMVALKVIHQNLIHDSEFISRFHQEAKLSASLNHPNIVTVHDIGQAGSVHYMAMELLEGRDLHQCIRQQGKISIYATVEIGKAMSKALDYAGKQGVIHRDVKSSNVFLHKDGRIILMDFGIAKAITDSGLTQIGEVMGTPEFMSPEQAQGRLLDARSDLYSLGVVLYECLAGRVPFTDQNKMAIVHSVIYDTVPSPKIYNPDVPALLESVVMKLLSKDPANRFSSGKELFQAIDYRSVASGNPAQASGGPGEIRKQAAYITPTETKPRARKGSAQRVALYSLLGVALVALLVVGYLLWSGESGGGGGGGGMESGSMPAPTKTVDSVNIYLDHARKMMDKGNLMEPKGNNTWFDIQRALIKSPDHIKANAMRSELAQKLKSTGDQNLNQRNYVVALKYYRWGNEVDPAICDYETNRNEVLNSQSELQIESQQSPEVKTEKNQEADQIARQKEVAEKKRLAKEEESKRKTQSGSGSFTDSRDGQTYPTVKIGNQVWMAKNLNYATNSGSWCYDNQSSNCDIYGRLYDWNTAKQVCPRGWHLPSDEEWKTMEEFLSGSVGGKLKETGNSHWRSPNTGATNSSGFAALPGGCRDDGGDFSYLGYYADFWSSSENGASRAWDRILGYYNDGVYRGNDYRYYGFSARCLQND